MEMNVFSKRNTNLFAKMIDELIDDCYQQKSCQMIMGESGNPIKIYGCNKAIEELNKLKVKLKGVK